MPNQLHDQVLNLFPPLEGTERAVIGEATSAEGTYLIVLERAEHEAGEFLIFAPSEGEPRIVLADTTVRPVDPRLAPENVRQALDALSAEEDQSGGREEVIDLESLFEPIRRAFERRDRNRDEGERGGNRPPQTGAVNARIFEATLRQEGQLSSRNVPGTNHGVLGCAWAVNYVVRDATGRPVGGGLSTALMYEALVGGRGTRIAQSAATPGSVIISPREGNVAGHVGIVGEGQRIYSNSSASALWVQNYTFQTWRRRYVELKGLAMHFFNVNG